MLHWLIKLHLWNGKKAKMGDEEKSTQRHVWINEEEKIVSFHPEEGYIEKVLPTGDDFVSFILIHGGSGYRFQ